MESTVLSTLARSRRGPSLRDDAACPLGRLPRPTGPWLVPTSKSVRPRAAARPYVLPYASLRPPNRLVPECFPEAAYSRES